MLETVQDGLWLAEGAVVGFFGVAYPTRSVIAKLPDGGLWVWSPVRLDTALRGAVDELGPVTHLVSPNKLHHLYIRDWQAAYPRAATWGPRSSIERHRQITFTGTLAETPPAAWQGVFDQVWFRGSLAMDEIVFFHRAAHCVILADLIEAFGDDFLQEHWHRWQRPLARLGGIHADDPHAPLDWRMTFLRRKLARAARARVLAWPSERVIMAHGQWQRSGGRDYLERAFDWLGRAA
jgi:hypothetical protein